MANTEALPKECYQRRPYPMAANDGTETWDARADDFVVAGYTVGAAITLPDNNYRLCRVLVETGATPGAFSILYDGQTVALFPAGSNGTNGANGWAVDWTPKGNVLPTAIFALLGGAAAVTLVFTKGKILAKVPPIAAYRAIRFTVTTAATRAAPVAFGAANYNVAPAVPRACLAYATKVGYLFNWPSIGAATGGGSADSQPTANNLHRAPPMPKSMSLNPSSFNPVTAAGTLDLYVLYDPVTGG